MSACTRTFELGRDRLILWFILRYLNTHSAMFWTMRRSDILDLLRRHANDKTAAFLFALGFQMPIALLLRPVSRSAIVSPPVDIEARMRQWPQRRGEFVQSFLQQDTGQGMDHFALQSDFDRRRAVQFAVLGIDRHDRMNKFMNQHAQHFFRFRQIRAHKNFEVFIGGTR